MLDIKYIRENAEAIKTAAKNKNLKIDIDQLLQVDKERTELLLSLENLNKLRNENSEKFKTTPKDKISIVVEEGKALKEKITEAEKLFNEKDKEFNLLMVQVPTIPAADVPVGKSEEENVEVERVGDPTTFSFTPKSHIELGKSLDILDLDRGAKVGGYRGYYVKNEGVLLMMGLMMYGLQKLISKGFTPIIPPTLVKEFCLFGSGYFKGVDYNPETDEIYKVASQDKEQSGEVSKDNKFLIGTAEPALLAYHSGEILDEKELPLKYVGFSQCYRSEIGSYGKDTKGIYRVHEFMKVEQVVICKADVDESDKFQQEMVSYSKEIFADLKIPYRLLQICTGDMSAGKYKMFDLEAWMPSRNGYGEVGSASNFVDWQARRLNVKYTDKDGNKKYVYMLNNTVIPSPRSFIAVLENYQQEDGSVIVPEVLRPYVGKDVIKPKEK